MKTIFFFILAFLTPSIIFSNSVDSLLQVTQSNQHDTIKIIAFEQLAANNRKSFPDTAIYYNQKAIELAKKQKNKKELAIAYREYALTAQAIGKYILAVDYYKKTLKTYSSIKDKEGVGEANNDIGIAYYYSGDYVNAREYFEKSGEIRIETGDSIGAGQSFNNTGIMYDIAGDPKQALNLYLRALSIYENVRDTNLIIGTMSNIGLIYIGQKNYKESLKIYSKQKRLAKKIESKISYGIALTSEGSSYDYLQEYQKARKNFKEALVIFIELGDKPLIAQCYNNLSVNYELTNEDDKALEYALKSIRIKKEIGSYGKLAVSQIAAAKIYNKKDQSKKALILYKEALLNAKNTGYVDYIIKAHKGLSKVYDDLRQYEKAFHHQSKYIALADSVTNKENTELINELEKKYQNDRKEQEIELLNTSNVLKDVELEKADEESKRKSLQLYGSLVVGLILLGFLVFVFRVNQQRKKNNLLLVNKNKEITYQKEIVEEQNQEIKDSITYAKRIQNAILPPLKVVKEYLQESFILYKPKDIVAGDFYWLESHGDIVLFAAADCTGHGVPGAMVSVVCNNGLNRSVREYGLIDPGEILNKTREIVVQEFEKSEEDVKDGMDIAICSLEGNTLKYAGAHNPLWIIRKGELLETKANKQPIGQFDNPEPYTTHTLELQKGDSLYIFSDGYADQFGGEKGKKLKTANFKKLLLSIQKENMQNQKQLIDEAFEKWKGDLEQLDDVCVIGVRI